MPIRVTYGYSRDHRRDLKQFVMNLVCWGDGDLPAFLELADGNQSDKAHFAEVLLAFQQQWQFEGLYVADSALYSEANLQALSGLQWLTRVPLTLTAAIDLVSTLPDSVLQATDRSGYRIASVCSDYGGVQQRWFVVESEARRSADLAQLERTIAKAAGQAQTRHHSHPGNLSSSGYFDAQSGETDPAPASSWTVYLGHQCSGPRRAQSRPSLTRV